MSGHRLNQTDPTFLDDLENSKRAQWVVARWLQQKGESVTVRANFVRPDPSVRGEYADEGDIEISRRVEVKHRPTMAFTCAEDFGFDTIIVDVAHRVDKLSKPAAAYYICNKDLTHCCIVPGTTRDQWVRTTRYDNHCHRQRDFYECPIGLCRFETIPASTKGA